MYVKAYFLAFPVTNPIDVVHFVEHRFLQTKYYWGWRTLRTVTANIYLCFSLENRLFAIKLSIGIYRSNNVYEYREKTLTMFSSCVQKFRAHRIRRILVYFEIAWNIFVQFIFHYYSTLFFFFFCIIRFQWIYKYQYLLNAQSVWE